jgi:phosphinothricin acetyltransferase
MGSIDRIRMATADDGDALAAIYAPNVTDSAISFELVAPTGDEMRRRVAAVLEHAPWLVLERRGASAGYEIAGYAYATKHRDRAAYQWSVDVSVYVAKAHHRAGVGRALYLCLFDLLRLQGFYLAHAGVTLPNPASVGLHESLGFRRVGIYPAVGYKLGAWRDVGWWRLPLRDIDPSHTPEPPRELTSAARDPRWTAALSRGTSSRT